MPKNESLHQAKRAKNDEFYTQYADIEREMSAYLEYNPDVFRDKTILLPCDDPEWSNFTKYFAQNFESFGIKKLISTSYAANSKPQEIAYQPTLFESSDPKFDQLKTRSRGKIFILKKDQNHDRKIDINDLEWDYLEGDGDFRSEEVCRLRDEADIIITNPPFSQFRDFLAWTLEGKKLFAMISNKNCVTYKEVFPLFKENKLWSGREEWAGGMWFETKYPDDVDKVINGINMKNTPSIWITNIDHGRRHQPLSLMTMADNLKYSKHKEIRERGYPKYDNYDAIEVSYTDAIPSDYKAGMGVPISFLDKYCPEQFEIERFRKGSNGKDLTYTIKDTPYTHTILPDYYQEESVMESWVFLSPSSTSSARSSSRLSAVPTTTDGQRAGLKILTCKSQSEARTSINASSSGVRSSWIMGVPISFLDKFCPEQFEIIGCSDNGRVDNHYKLKHFKKHNEPYVHGKKTYKRIFIKFKED